MYVDSTNIGIVITTADNTFYAGAGKIILPAGITQDDYKTGWIKGGKLRTGITHSYLEICNSQDILFDRYYKTAVVYDNLNKVIGIAITEM